MNNNIKWLLPRLPLPMLALAASYGVYQFALLFVPWWVALVQAAAFEVTYIGLAMIETESAEQRKRAVAISIGAVIVSVLYNSLAGFLHRNGLGQLPLFGEIVLATLHGAPLAIVAYLVADLLLHKDNLMGTPTKPSAAAIEHPVTPATIAQEPIIELLLADLEDENEEPTVSDPVADSATKAAKPKPSNGKKPSLRERVTSALEDDPDLLDATLYDLFPSANPSSIRSYASLWRRENLIEEIATTNGRH